MPLPGFTPASNMPTKDCSNGLEGSEACRIGLEPDRHLAPVRHPAGQPDRGGIDPGPVAEPQMHMHLADVAGAVDRLVRLDPDPDQFGHAAIDRQHLAALPHRHRGDRALRRLRSAPRAGNPGSAGRAGCADDRRSWSDSSGTRSITALSRITVPSPAQVVCTCRTEAPPPFLKPARCGVRWSTPTSSTSSTPFGIGVATSASSLLDAHEGLAADRAWLRCRRRPNAARPGFRLGRVERRIAAVVAAFPVARHHFEDRRKRQHGAAKTVEPAHDMIERPPALLARSGTPSPSPGTARPR